ncbi:MAG: PilZ domain-containing protein [Candidatus Omnitrophica bacterium]|nr:PilZ domain-containing protein [Candidatus Omnitrophota bacterium]
MREKERRKSSRLTAYHLVKCKKLSPDGTPGENINATILDIGSGGVRLRSREFLPVTSLLELKINFPSLNTPIFTLAKVRWVKTINKTQWHATGAQFVDIEDEVRKVIERQVKGVYQRLRNKRSFPSMFDFLLGRKR